MATIALGALAFGVSLLTLVSGFGLGTLLMPAFALLLPIEVAVAATALVHAANNVFKLGLLAGHVDRGVAVRFGIPAVAASFAGAALLTTLSTGEAVLVRWAPLGRPAEIVPVKVVMGALVIAFALLDLVPSWRAWRAPAGLLPLGGAISGFFGGLSGHQGALRAAFLGPLALPPAVFASTQAALAVLVDGTRLVVYGWTFLRVPPATPIPWRVVAVASACAFAGSLAGARLLRAVTLETVRLIVGVLLVVVGTAMMLGLA